MHTMCMYCVERKTCIIYKNIINGNVTSLDDKYPAFNVIKPNDKDKLCILNLDDKLLPTTLVGINNKHCLS